MTPIAAADNDFPYYYTTGMEHFFVNPYSGEKDIRWLMLSLVVFLCNDASIFLILKSLHSRVSTSTILARMNLLHFYSPQISISIVPHFCHQFHHPCDQPRSLSPTVLRLCLSSNAAVSVVPSYLPPPYWSPLSYLLPLYPSLYISSGRRSTFFTAVFDFPSSPMPSSYTPPFSRPESLLYALRKTGNSASVAAHHFLFPNTILRVQL